MAKPLFKKICIVGIGLIGGSIGMAVKKKRIAGWVTGVARRKQTVFEALSKNAIDAGTLDLKKGAEGADLVILCTPVSAIIEEIKMLPKVLKRGAIVIDAGSSKVEIEKAARKYLRKSFVGCHPMAGSEKTGIEAASADLFLDSVCFITARNSRVESFWKKLGSRPVVLSAAAHDSLVAKTSHTPHAIAFSLFQTKKEFPKNTPANPSIRELMRLAKSDPELWADVFISSRETLLKAILEFEHKGLHRMKNLLRSGKKQDFVRFISEANKNAGLLR